jgi:hypothetical protein
LFDLKKPAGQKNHIIKYLRQNFFGVLTKNTKVAPTSGDLLRARINCPPQQLPKKLNLLIFYGK